MINTAPKIKRKIPSPFPTFFFFISGLPSVFTALFLLLAPCPLPLAVVS
jgi:hypothetical protein